MSDQQADLPTAAASAPGNPFGASPPYNYLEMLDHALAPLDVGQGKRLLPILQRLSMLVFADWIEAEAGNPVDHHLFVLRHMMLIAAAEKYSESELLQAAAIALLHDIAPVHKLPRTMVKELMKVNPDAGAALEVQRISNRTLHMREGSARAQRRLLQLNHSLGRVVFSAADIETVCEVIRIHDNPSIDIPISRSDKLAVAFREADRLWMVTMRGLSVDLERAGKAMNDLALLRKQLESNLDRFREERQLYPSGEELFQDRETFIRTMGGHELLDSLLTDMTNAGVVPQNEWLNASGVLRRSGD